jgi:hypothetical protein
MALLKLSDLYNTLDKTRFNLIAAMDGDGMVSRADLKQLLAETDDPFERRFLEYFYGFLIKLEDRPRMRVTEDVIDQGIVYIREQIITNFEIRDTFTLSTNHEIAGKHEAAFPMAMELLRYAANKKTLSPKAVSEQIDELTEGLYFDDYGSEAATTMDAFFLEHPDTNITPESFTTALGLDPTTPQGKVERFDPAYRVLQSLTEQHLRSGRAEQARNLVELMTANLDNLTIIVIGEDLHPDLESTHPVFVVGTGKNGNLAGFSSAVIWT